MYGMGNDYQMGLRRQQIMEKVEGWQPLQPGVSMHKTANSRRPARLTRVLRLALGAGLVATLLGGAPQITKAHTAITPGQADVLDGPVLRETPDLAGLCARHTIDGFITPISYGDPLRIPTIHPCYQAWMELV